MKQKLLSLALTLALCLGLAAPALAAESDFRIENGVLIKYTGSGGAVTIPEGVTEIGDTAFIGCTSLASVTIPSSVTKIGQSAFASCEGLTSITIPSGVTEIGDNAFVWCTSLTSITEIGRNAFDTYTGPRAYEAAAAETKLNGAAATLEAIVLKDDQGGAYTYYKLRDLGEALGFTVDWTAETGIFIETN